VKDTTLSGLVSFAISFLEQAPRVSAAIAAMNKNFFIKLEN
jgi:hypothetical protein